jgi:hypothetical protein
MGKLVEKPQNSVVIMVLHNPSKMMGFLPNLSDAAPHGIPVKLWHMEKVAEVRPAQRAMSFCGMPKLSIISGR